MYWLIVYDSHVQDSVSKGVLEVWISTPLNKVVVDLLVVKTRSEC